MTELEKYQAVNRTNSLEELAQVIESFAENGRIEGREQDFDVANMANYCRNYSESIHNFLTRKWGIRQQAMYLLFYNKK